MTRGLLAALCLALVCAGCSTDESPDPADPTDSPTALETSSSTEPTPEPAKDAKTIELRYTFKPRSDGVVSVKLPPLKPGGTLVTWSAYLVGVGTGASPTDPRKVECYVVQATGPAFEDRVYYVADASTFSMGTDVSLSGSGLVDTADGRRLAFECELDDNSPATIPGVTWRTLPEQPVQVTLTPVDYQRRDVTLP